MKRTFATLMTSLLLALALALPAIGTAQITTTTKFGLQMTLKEVIVDYDDLQAAAADASTDTAVYIDDVLPIYADALPLYLEAAVVDTVDSATTAEVSFYYMSSGDTIFFYPDTLDVGTANRYLSHDQLINTAFSGYGNQAIFRNSTITLYYRSNITLDAITAGRIRIRAYYINE